MKNTLRKKFLTLFLLLSLPFFSHLPFSPFSLARAAEISLASHTVPFGQVMEGQVAKVRVHWDNPHPETIVIKNVKTTCGCTAVSLKSGTQIPKGGGLDFWVEIDTRGKRGEIQKGLTIRYETLGPLPELNEAQFDLKGEVNPVVHPKIEGGPHADLENPANVVFQGECASCHIDPIRREKSGRALYDAICAICHGEVQSMAQYPESHDPETLRKAVLEGNPETSMPAFGPTGGQLDEIQSENLLGYIQSEMP